MSVFAAAAAAIHADPNLSVPATYRPAAGPAVALRTIRTREQSADGFGLVEVAHILERDLADAPRHGDELVIGRDVYVVERAESESRNARWRLTLSA